MKHLIALLLLLPLAAPALADESTPLYYARGAIRILAQGADTPAPLPWQEPQPGWKAPLALDAELRDAATFYRQQGWFSLTAPGPGHGVLLLFAAPTMAPIAQATQYAPLDILLADEHGRIVRIIPGIVLAELERDILPERPVQAFLLLGGGECERLGIKPGDVIDHKAFKNPPPGAGM